MNSKLLVPLCAAAALLAACSDRDKDTGMGGETTTTPATPTETPPPAPDSMAPPPADTPPPPTDTPPPPADSQPTNPPPGN